MAAQSKYNEVVEIIERRIREGDYLLDRIPGERKIAEETGVSYMTARRAVTELLEQKVLIRGASGALEVHPGYTKKAKLADVVLLYPAYPSSYLTQLRGLVSDYAERHGVGLRPVQFVHWDEKMVLEAVEQARGAIIIPSGAAIPGRLLESFRENKVVILDGDYTAHGLPSIRLFSDRCISDVIEHLYALGHTHVDCLNTQNRNPETERRIAIWESCQAAQGARGVLWDDPAPLFTDPTIAAYRLMTRLLDEKKIAATAIVTTTCPGAIGAMRACWLKGIAVGKDVSIASVNIEPPAEFFCPSITGLATPDLTKILGGCFEWFASRQETWMGPKLLEPRDSVIFKGESAGPVGLSRSLG